MKRIFIWCLFSIFTAATTLSCSKHENINGGKENNGNEGHETPGTTLPAPPDEIVEGNVFTVDFFSALDDKTFFLNRDYNTLASHIKRQVGKKPVAYMIDRADFSVGETNRILKIAKGTSTYAYFAQNEKSGDNIRGTGLITSYTINKYDGVAASSAYMSGLCMDISLNQTVPVCIYTSSIESVDVLKKLIKVKGKELRSIGVLIGTFRQTEKERVMEYVKNEAGPVRFTIFGKESSAYDLFVMTPGSFACRSITEEKTSDCPYYRILIEKLQ